MTAIVDTGIVFGFYSIRDRYHLDSIAIMFHLYKGVWGRVFITNHLLDEIVNILKYKVSIEVSKDFIERFIEKRLITIVYTDKDIESQALDLFKKYVYRKGFSYTDAITVAVMREYDIDYLLTYDLRSFQRLVDNIIGPGYWNSLSDREKRYIKEMVHRL